jgi:isopenicillin-N epimerase
MMNLKSQFLLRDDIAYLNFGSFGACPRPVFERYQQYQLELEQEPVQFIIGNGMRYLEQSRIALGKYINCNADDVVYVTNPSYAVNLVAKNLDLQPGDEVLTTDIEYGACDKTWQYYCQQSGANYLRSKVALPVTDRAQLVEDFVRHISPKTRLIFISHITSSTALRLPVEEICAAAKERGIPIFIDGAHAPGQIPVDLQALGVDMYTGACHKWMMTPKGSSFFYATKAWQDRLDPLIVSWGYNALFPSKSKFLDYHQMNGTRDYSAFLTIPDAIAFMEKHDWDTVSQSCRALVKENAPVLCDLLQTSPLAPLTDEFILQLFSAEIKTTEPEKLHDVLIEKYKVQIPVMRHGDKVYLRYSIQAYNEQADLDRLFDALEDIMKTTELIQS